MPGTVRRDLAESLLYAPCNPYRGSEAVLRGVFARCLSEWDGYFNMIVMDRESPYMSSLSK